MVHLGITDTHAHLADPIFDKDRVEIIRRAQRTGGSRWIDAGSFEEP